MWIYIFFKNPVLFFGFIVERQKPNQGDVTSTTVLWMQALSGVHLSGKLPRVWQCCWDFTWCQHAWQSTISLPPSLLLITSTSSSSQASTVGCFLDPCTKMALTWISSDLRQKAGSALVTFWKEVQACWVKMAVTNCYCLSLALKTPGAVTINWL